MESLAHLKLTAAGTLGRLKSAVEPHTIAVLDPFAIAALRRVSGAEVSFRVKYLPLAAGFFDTKSWPEVPRIPAGVAAPRKVFSVLPIPDSTAATSPRGLRSPSSCAGRTIEKTSVAAPPGGP